MRIDWGRQVVTWHPEDQVTDSRMLMHLFDAEVINVDTGQDVGLDVRWADDRTGEYEELVRNEEGKLYVVNEDDGLPYTDEWEREGKVAVIASRIVKANIRFVFPIKKPVEMKTGPLFTLTHMEEQR